MATAIGDNLSIVKHTVEKVGADDPTVEVKLEDKTNHTKKE